MAKGKIRIVLLILFCLMSTMACKQIGVEKCE